MPNKAGNISAVNDALVHNDHGGGNSVRHQVSVHAIEERGGTQVLSVSSHVGSPIAATATTRCAFDVQTFKPHGELVMRQPVENSNLALEPGEAVDVSFYTPQGLSDGYYRTLLVFAAKSEKFRDEGFDEVYYKVKAGDLEPMEPGDWRNESGENRGTQAIPREPDNVKHDQQSHAEEVAQ
jgi:hypothetical protein